MLWEHFFPRIFSLFIYSCYALGNKIVICAMCMKCFLWNVCVCVFIYICVCAAQRCDVVMVVYLHFFFKFNCHYLNIIIKCIYIYNVYALRCGSMCANAILLSAIVLKNDLKFCKNQNDKNKQQPLITIFCIK